MNIQQIPSPAFVLDEKRLRNNLEIIDRVQREAGVAVILAFKGFAMWSAFPLVRQYLKGATASSLNEARLCFEEMGVPAHTYAVAYVPSEFGRILKYSSHITFNSIGQYERYRSRIARSRRRVSPGIRVNPGWSPVGTDLYNPATPGSRLGEPIANFEAACPKAWRVCTSTYCAKAKAAIWSVCSFISRGISAHFCLRCAGSILAEDT